jgi:hypothetical protein
LQLSQEKYLTFRIDSGSEMNYDADKGDALGKTNIFRLQLPLLVIYASTEEKRNSHESYCSQ